MIEKLEKKTWLKCKLLFTDTTVKIMLQFQAIN